MERMEEKVPGTKYDPLRYFLSDSNRDRHHVNDQAAEDADKLSGGKEDGALFIDESGIPEKGKMSVGVSRQWCGRLGKTDNCQAAVFATSGYDRFSTPIDCRLYLPKSWTDDGERCLEAKVPADKIVFRTKHEQAPDMVFHAKKNGVRFNRAGCDGFYGSNPQFLRKVDDNDEKFMADVHKDRIIYIEDPDPVVPKAKSNKGKRPSRLKAQEQGVRVDKWVKQQPDNACKRMKVRNTTKGELIVDIPDREVRLRDGKEAEARKWHLIVRREVNSPKEIKYSLSNAASNTSTRRLAYMQAQRYRVERPFQDAKNECGTGDYQGRLGIII